LINNEDIQSVTVSINKTAVEKLFEDSIEFTEKWKNTTRYEREELRQALANAYKTTVAKITLNFGKTVPPVLEKLSDLFKELAINDQCDQNCAVDCFNFVN